MIVATVGSQLPFDRLIRLLDDVALDLKETIFAQIGGSKYKPSNMKWSETVDPAEFDGRLRSCSAIVSHAGIGTVLKAYSYKKPVILMPRRKSLGEHRNDHQLATVASLQGREGIYFAETAEDFRELLSRPLLPACETERDRASKDKLQLFVRDAALTAFGNRA